MTNDDARVGTGIDDEEAAGEDRTESGTITAVNLDGIAADGPAVVTIKTTAGATAQIQVPSFGLGLCEAKANITDVYSLKAGDKIEVRGELTSDGSIVPCQSSEHYLRVK